MSHISNGAVDPSFALLMVTLAAGYPSVRLREDTIRAYAAQLGDLSLDQVSAAMSAAMRESEFFPTVAAIRKQAVGTADDAALVAWTALGNAASAAGAYGSVEVEDGAAAEALQAVFGSWPEFCACEDGPGLAIKRQEFLAAYRTARRRTGLRFVRLPGLCEASGKYPTDADATRVWIAKVAQDGTVTPARDRRGLGPAAARREIGPSGDEEIR